MLTTLPLTLFAALAVAPAPTSPPPGSDEAEAYSAAKADFNGNRYLEAASAFDALWSAYNNPKYLHYAALAWATVGEDARAILRWRRLLTLANATTKDIENAERHLAGARDRTTALSLTLSPAIDGQLSLTRQNSVRGPIDLPLTDLAAPSGAELFPLFLEPGEWTLVFRPAEPRYAETSAELTIDDAAQAELKLDIPLVTSPLSVSLGPPAAAQAGVMLTLREADGRAPEIQLQTNDTQLSVDLPAGAWSIHAESPLAPPLDEQLTVRPGEAAALRLTFDVPVSSPPAEPEAERPPKLQHPRLALGLGIGAAAALGIGGVLVGVAESRIATSDRDTNIPPNCTTLAADGRYRGCIVDGSAAMIAGGSALLGGSLGLATTSVLAHKGIRRRVWSAPLVTGLAALAGGATWYYAAYAANPVFDRLTVEEPFLNADDLRFIRRNYYPPSMLMGLGGGLVFGAVAGLIASRQSSKNRKANAPVARSLSRAPGIVVRF